MSAAVIGVGSNAARKTARRLLHLPRVTELVMEEISTFSRAPRIVVKFDAGATCFAGANGIGKSTLLSLMMYGLTGAVPSEKREFKDLKDYRHQAAQATRTYFDGRIAEKDRDDARFRVTFTCGDVTCVVERRFFVPDSITRLEFNGRLVRYERAAKFEERITKAVGVKTFDQYVFLCHFLCVFDEARHLLFWDARAIEQLLFLAFSDEGMAVEAENARRLMEKAGSRARNLQFEAKKVQDRLKELLATSPAQSADYQELFAKYEATQAERNRILEELDNKAEESSTVNIRIAEAAAELSSLRAEYSKVFQETLRGHVPLADHPICRALASTDPCPVCASPPAKSRNRAIEAIEKNICPVCGVPYVLGTSGRLMDRLDDLDRGIARAQSALDAESALLARLDGERTEGRTKTLHLERDLIRYERQHPDVSAGFQVLKSVGSGSSDFATAIRAHQVSLQEILADKERALVQRDKHRKQLERLQRELAERYSTLEQDFVPTLQDLAKRFLGLDVAVRLRVLRRAEVSLSLDVAGTRREIRTKLSESQRFFVDIALRMAIGSFLAGDSGAELYIDTPEGSLDIAYESCAGEMFAQFVRAGNDLVITANINTSALLLRLAQRCKAALMQLVPMTGWSALSDVQRSEQQQFDAALGHVRAALR